MKGGTEAGRNVLQNPVGREELESIRGLGSRAFSSSGSPGGFGLRLGLSGTQVV